MAPEAQQAPQKGAAGQPPGRGSQGQAPALAAPGTAGGEVAPAHGLVKVDVESRRRQAEEQAQRSLDQDAIAAIDESEKALELIAAGKKDEAIAALERATGKINVLLARNPKNALIPVKLEVEAIDLAPLDIEAIHALADAAETAVDDRDFPAARAVLQNLVSEIRVRTYTLPLATYPVAMTEAARLLDQNMTEEATAVLLTALNTLVIVDHVTPLPIAVAQEAVADAQALRDKDKEKATKLLELAEHELERARELGYAGKDPEYQALNSSIEDLKKQLKGDQDTESAFAKLRERIGSFFRRQSETEKKAQVAARAM
ncbi:MAG: YfdX family protein [Candidatus Binatia bacterium]